MYFYVYTHVYIYIDYLTPLAVVLRYDVECEVRNPSHLYSNCRSYSLNQKLARGRDINLEYAGAVALRCDVEYEVRKPTPQPCGDAFTLFNPES